MARTANTSRLRPNSAGNNRVTAPTPGRAPARSNPARGPGGRKQATAFAPRGGGPITTSRPSRQQGGRRPGSGPRGVIPGRTLHSGGRPIRPPLKQAKPVGPGVAQGVHPIQRSRGAQSVDPGSQGKPVRQTSVPKPVRGHPGVFQDTISSTPVDRPLPSGVRAQIKLNPNSSISDLAAAAGMDVGLAKARIERTAQESDLASKAGMSLGRARSRIRNTTRRGQTARANTFNRSLQPLTRRRSQLNLS